MYEKVLGTAHHLAAENITTPWEGNDSVPEKYLAYCTCSFKENMTVCASGVNKRLEKIELSLLMGNQNNELFCHGTPIV